MTSDLLELNFENLVSFYCEELRRIEQGERAPDVFSKYVRGRLRECAKVTLIESSVREQQNNFSP